MNLLNLIPSKTKILSGMGQLLLSATLLLVGLLNVSQAYSAGFGVIVVDEFGTPMRDAAVCFGLPGTPNQFGSFTTASDGRVMVEDLPRIPLNITVSKQNYQGVQFVETLKNIRMIKEVTLLLDGDGPICETKVKPVLSSLKIKNLRARSVGKQLRIESRISGDPTHYRISNREDFKDAKWIPYKTSFSFRQSANRNETLYFQVRRYSASNRSWIEARSHVSTLSVN